MPQNLTAFEPFLAFGGKIDPLAEIRNAGIVTSGSVLWVKATADSDYTTFQFQVGANIVLNGVQTAINKTRNDKNDYVLVVPQDTNTVYNASDVSAGTALLLNKARTHILGVGYNKALFGYAPTLRGLGTAAAFDTAVVRVISPGIELGGLRILGTAGTNANGTMVRVLEVGTAAAGTGHELYVHDCNIEAIQASGGGAGGTADIVGIVGATGATGVRFDNVMLSGTGAGHRVVVVNNIGNRHEFHNCRFLINSQATTDYFIAPGTGQTEYAWYERCAFINMNSAQLPASAFVGSTSTTNPVLLDYCTGVNVTAFGTDPTVYCAPNVKGTSAAGVANPGIYLRGSAPITAA